MACFQPKVHYLPDLVASLEKRHPQSPLLSVLRPLVATSTEELTKQVAVDYENLRTTPELTPEQREAWLDVFHYWLMVRLKVTMQELRKMIFAQLPEVEETPWGQELKSQWTSEGMAKGKAEGRTAELMKILQRSREQLDLYAQMFASNELPAIAYQRLKAKVEQEVRQYQEELDRLAQQWPSTKS